MSTRRPSRPLSPLSTKVARTFDQRPHGLPAMPYPSQVETQNPDESLSLSSLEKDADDFDRRMIQTARDERRLNDARAGNVQAFRKARTHPRVAVTLENLQRHNAKSNVALGPDAQVRLGSPPSSSGSTRSDPALNVPSGWGRKGRVKRGWMRSITTGENQESAVREDTVDPIARDPEETPGVNLDADEPRQSIEDSPLSHKRALHGTPASTRRQSIEDWDFDMNEASLIASTPYLPRNPVLDDIRQREIESLKEQGVATTRLDKIRGSSPEEMRRPRSTSTKSTASHREGRGQEQARAVGMDPSELRPGKRTNSWQAVGKAPVVTGERMEKSPIVVYKKSSETVGMVDNRLLANAQANPRRPIHRRDDSHDLLRRLARASNTPSPGRVETLRPQSVPTKQIENSSRTGVTGTSPLASENPASDRLTTNNERSNGTNVNHKPSNENLVQDTDATPVPEERSILDPKTPVVTGAWVDTMIDTPAPEMTQTPTEPSQRSTISPQKLSPNKKSAQDPQPSSSGKEVQKPVAPPQVSKPSLPGSVLEAIVEEAKASGLRRRSTDYGDSTINSLEELMAPFADTSEPGEPDEDTLGLDVPTGKPRTETERRRREELLYIQRMDQKLRSTRTSLRDTNRGMRRVEEQIERSEEQNSERNLGHAGPGTGEKIIYREVCPCVASGGHQFSLWKAFRLCFYDESLKPKRRGSGLTLFSIALISFLAWFVAENIACEIWGHYTYASSYKGYGVVWGAPEYPYVLPTMTYRAFIKPWWRPLWSFLLWMWRAMGGNAGEAQASVPSTTATRIAERILVRDQARRAFEEEAATILGMAGDEVVQ